MLKYRNIKVKEDETVLKKQMEEEMKRKKREIDDTNLFKDFDEDEKDCSDYHWMMARNLGPLGEHREAIAHLRKAKDHDEAALYEEFGWNYSEMELYDKALDYFQRAAHLREEKSGWLLAQLGCTEARLGHYPKADAYLKEALEKGYDTP